jgi:hypothetical protein
MGFAKDEAEIAERAARFLKAVKRADVTYDWPGGSKNTG